MGQVTVKAGDYKNVKDTLDYLSQSEEARLKEEIDIIAKENQLDVVIVIVEDTEGKSSMAFADDYYDYNGYGIGSDYSGLLMLVNMGKREVWISTTGRAINIFTDRRIATMIDNVKKPLGSAKYYEACSTFLKDVRSYASTGTAARGTYFERVVKLIKTFYVYIAALVIAVIATVIASLSSKGKVTISSQTYEKQGSFDLFDSRDDYIRETTTKTKIESNSGKSSTHKGSSGRSHGGGGGSF